MSFQSPLLTFSGLPQILPASPETPTIVFRNKIPDTLRQRAWPKLVGLHGPSDVLASHRRTDSDGSCSSTRTSSSLDQSVIDAALNRPKLKRKKTLVECIDADQIARDVARCTWHLLTGSQRSRRRQMRNKHRKKVASLLRRKQRRLGNLINLVLVRSYEDAECENERLRYYQGYHDVASVFLSALGGASAPVTPTTPTTAVGGNDLDADAAAMGLDLPSRVLLQVSRSHLRDAMGSGFQALSAALRLIILPLIGALDSEVHAHLYDCEMEPFFALSWIITWFSHDVRDTSLVKRLFDVFIVSHPLMPIYMSVAMVLHPINRIDILSTDCDFASVHNALASLPINSSSVGWKMMGDGGYMSGEEDDDEITASVDMSMMSDDFLPEDRDDEESEAPSFASSNLWNPGRGARVPFQDLIDMAISYMRQIPPRKLLNLARRYYTEAAIQPMLGMSSSIALLQPPPSWGLASTTPSDWVLKQRARERRGIPSSRRERRSRARQRSRSRGRSESKDTAEDVKEHKKPKKDVANGDVGKSEDVNNIEYRSSKNDEKSSKDRVRAIIASGVGPDGEEERRERRRRRLIIWSGIAVALVSIAWVLIQNGSIQRPQNIMLGKSVGEIEAGGIEESSDTATISTEECQSKDVGLDFDAKPAVSGEKVSESSVVREQHNGNKKGQMPMPLRFIRAMIRSARADLGQNAEIVAL